jgi:hypothetical protein
MNHPANYTNDDWASWYERTRMHVRMAPAVTRDLQSCCGASSISLVGTAAASLADIDEDIVAGEFLAQIMPSATANDAVRTIVTEMSNIAQDLLQVIVEARKSPDWLRNPR